MSLEKPLGNQEDLKNKLKLNALGGLLLKIESKSPGQVNSYGFLRDIYIKDGIITKEEADNHVKDKVKILFHSLIMNNCNPIDFAREREDWVNAGVLTAEEINLYAKRLLISKVESKSSDLSRAIEIIKAWNETASIDLLNP